jgi:hypothetical protein
MSSVQVTLRRLVGWQDLKSLKSQAAAWQLDTQLLNSPHRDAKLLFHHLTDSTDADQVQTELGLIYIVPGGRVGIQVHAQHLTVDGLPLQAPAYLASNGQAQDSIWFKPYYPQNGYQAMESGDLVLSDEERRYEAIRL